jgi:hypothetical protein
MFQEERHGFPDKKGSNHLRFLWSRGFMSSAFGWNLFGGL